MKEYVPATPSEMKALLKKVDLTPSQVAEIVGISERDIRDHLQGVEPIDRNDWHMLTTVLDL